VELDASEFPILNINLYGDYSHAEFRSISDDLKDRIESIQEISKVDIKGLDDRQINVNLDRIKMAAKNINFQNVEDAISFENHSISGGDIINQRTSRSVRIDGEFKNITELNNLIVKYEKGNIVYLSDILEGNKVKDGYVDPLTYAQLNGKNVVTLSVVKKSGENLLIATENIMKVLEESKNNGLIPPYMEIEITNDMSDHVRDQVSNLENSIIMGMILVIVILFYFLGLRNALFVGLAIPTSMLISFVIISLLGYTINMMILFGLVLALGMLVDNAIVVVENIYRYLDKGYSVFEAAKQGTGEIAWPIISSTATTLAAFLPLIFWPGIVGSFMGLLPKTLIIVLTASLFVALVIVPAFIIIFVKDGNVEKPFTKKGVITTLIIMAVVIGLGYLTKIFWLANFTIFMAAFVTFYYKFFYKWGQKFQSTFLVFLEEFYLKTLTWSLSKKRPYYLLGSAFVLLFGTLFFYAIAGGNVLFFPNNEPQFINITAKLPIGTDIDSTFSFAQALDQKVNRIIKKDSSILKSVLTTVGKGAIGQNEQSFGNNPEKAMITVTFIDYDLRKEHRSSVEIMKDLSDSLIGNYPGVQLSVEKNQMGPPTGKAINIEIQGPDYPSLIHYSDSLIAFLEKANIPGIEGLKTDLDNGKPEIMIEVDREKARRFGLSTGQVASSIRTALFGKEVSDFKDGEDKIPIRIRYAKDYRNNLSSLLNQNIVFRNNQGHLLEIPASSVVNVNYTNTYGSVNRKDMERVITVYSNVLEGYNANAINAQLKKLVANFNLPKGYVVAFTGEQEEQNEASSFLINALLIAVALIFLILVTQFNSFAKPFIILVSVILSTIGVFGGLATFNMDFVIIMTGIGIISLAGIVVNNAIVLIDYIDLLKNRLRTDKGLPLDANLTLEETIACVEEAGKTRLRPVLLTAITTVLGLIPMAIGLNIDFAGLLNSWSPNIYFGGENADFWGSMAWTVIFGLTFSTVLTLIYVPVMYVLGNKLKLRFAKK
jgi:multidrug efflux pump subunit AcrB